MGASAGCDRCTRATPEEQIGSNPTAASNGLSTQETDRRSLGTDALGELPDECNFEDCYTYHRDDVLGSGQTGVVYRCTSKKGRERFALKLVMKQRLRSSACALSEARILRSVDHPNVVRLIRSFEEDSKVFLVLELCSGGELFDYVVDYAPLTEHVSRLLFQQMLRAVSYLHMSSIIHRDLKAENWLFADHAPAAKTTLKLADFGTAKMLGPKDFARTKIGTPYYVAPEVLQGRYRDKADIWSSGIVLHMFLGGAPPFAGGKTEEVLDKVRGGKVNLELFGRFASKPAKHLLASMLDQTPEKRPSAGEALHHEWFLKGKAAKEGPMQRMPTGLLDNFRSFGCANKLEQASLALLATQLSREALAKLEQAFLALDVNGDGSLSLEEMGRALLKCGVRLNKRELQELLVKVDVNHSGAIEYSEFVAIMTDHARCRREDFCRRAFRAFDLDDSGHIDRAELAALLRSEESRKRFGAGGGVLEAVAAICAELDSNSDGRIGFKEFVAMLDRNENGPPKAASTQATSDSGWH